MAGNKSATLTIVIAGDAKGLSKSLKGTETQVASLGSQFKKMAGGVAAGLGTAAVIKFGKDSVGAYASAGREVLKLKRLTGETAEEASLLRFAAQQSGVSVEQMAKAWVLFGKSIESGKVEAAGIAIKDTNGQLLDSDVILANTADKFAGMADGVQKNTLAVTLFGRSGAALLPFLSKGSAGISDLKSKMDELGVSFDEAGLQKVKDYTKAQREMGAAMEGLKFTIGSALMPVLTDATTTIGEFIPKITHAVGMLGDVPGLGAVADGAKGMVGPVVLASGAVVGLGAAYAVLGPAIAAATPAIVAAAPAMAALASGIVAYNVAYKALESQAKFVGDTAALGAALKKLGTDGGSATPAIKEVSGSTKDLANAIKGLNKESAGGTGQRLKDALDLGAGARSAAATKNELKALDEELVKLAETDPAAASAAFTAITLALAKQGVTVDEVTPWLPKYSDAVDGIKATPEIDKITRDLEKQKAALEKSAELQRRYKAEMDGIKAAQDAVKTSHDGLNAAIVKVADAHDRAAQAASAEKDAEEAAVQADAQVVSAKRAVQDAIEQVSQARRAAEANSRALAAAEKDEVASVAAIGEARANLARLQREATGDSDAMRSALERVAAAEDTLRKADEDAEAAQRRLSDARANYGNVLADLKDQKTSAELDVNDAERRLREAEAAVANLGRNADGSTETVTADQHGAAIDAVTRAEIALRRAKAEAAEAAAKANKEESAGVENSTAVVDAKDDVTAAAGRQEQAHDDLEVAVKNVADTQVAADKAVSDAEQIVREKIDARMAAHQRVLDAKQTVVDGQAAIQKAVEGVGTAEAGVATAAGDAKDAHDLIVTKKQEYEDAAREIRDAEYGVALAYAAIELAVKSLDRYLASRQPGAPGTTSNGYTVGGGPAGHNTGDRSSKGQKGRSGTGRGKARGVNSSDSGKPQHGKPPRPDTDYEPDKGTPPGEAGTVTGQPSDQATADQRAYALENKADFGRKMRRVPPSQRNIFHLHGVTDMQVQATMIARQLALQSVLAGGH